MHARRRSAKINLDFTPLSAKPSRTSAAKVIDQIGTVGVEETGELGTVVNVNVAQGTLPPGTTLAAETALLKGNALGIVFTWVSIGSARIDCDVAICSGVTILAEAGVISNSRFGFTHGLFRARVVATVG